ncbi:hypothetical protein BD309DRAFT_645041 [Dichomitus squalens]|nr:hypothetical protein BD309DRAFT_645041 [Dichomitus squalens]
MSDDDPTHHQQNISPSTTASYVYPIRSLLSGIQAASNAGASDESSTLPSTPTTIPEAPLEGAATTHLSRGVGGRGAQLRAVSSESSLRSHGRHKHSIPNFRDFPPDQSPFSPRTFSTALPSSCELGSGPGADILFSPDPTSETVVYLPAADSSLDTHIPRHPPHLSDVAAGAFAGIVSRSALVPDAAAEDIGIQRGAAFR